MSITQSSRASSQFLAKWNFAFASRFVLFLALALISFSACKPQDEVVTPDGAKQILQLRGFEPNAKGYFAAIQAEDLAAIRTFFQTGLDPNMTSEKGETPLTLAVVCCEVKTVRALLEKVDINARDRDGNTALYLALKRDRKEIFDLLLERNADVNVPAKGNSTVLHLAAGTDDLATARKLVERGANVNAVNDSQGDIPLIQSCIGNYPQTKMIELFLDKGADINHQGKNKATCLIYVAAAGHKELVQELLDRGADPKLKDIDGKTARDWALKGGYKDVAALLGKK